MQEYRFEHSSASTKYFPFKFKGELLVENIRKVGKQEHKYQLYIMESGKYVYIDSYEDCIFRMKCNRFIVFNNINEVAYDPSIQDYETIEIFDLFKKTNIDYHVNIDMDLEIPF